MLYSVTMLTILINHSHLPQIDSLYSHLVTYLSNAVKLYVWWQWRDFFIPVYASCFCRHDV